MFHNHKSQLAILLFYVVSLVNTIVQYLKRSTSFSSPLPTLSSTLIFPQLSQDTMSFYIWILYLRNATIDEYLAGVIIPFHCLFLVVETTERGATTVTEVYAVDESSPLSTNLYCTWRKETRLQCSTESLLMRRSSLVGVQFKVTVPNVSTRIEESILLDSQKQIDPKIFSHFLDVFLMERKSI